MKLTKYEKEAIARAILNDIPKIDFVKRRADIQASIVKAMSPAVRKVYKTMPDALRTYHIGEIGYDGITWGSRDVIVGDVGDDKLNDVLAPYKTENKMRDDARSQLRCAIMACSTTIQIAKRFPEFKSYLPTEEKPTANLPALVNVVSDLSKLGWPKK